MFFSVLYSVFPDDTFKIVVLVASGIHGRSVEVPHYERPVVHVASPDLVSKNRGLSQVCPGQVLHVRTHGDKPLSHEIYRIELPACVVGHPLDDVKIFLVRYVARAFKHVAHICIHMKVA